ncbi:MAG: WecB/TagA/CpsF family glycosyltransferase [Microcoleaceae cyanobacterium]
MLSAIDVQAPHRLPRKKVVDASITALRFEDQMRAILRWARRGESRTVCVANVHMVMEAYWDHQFNQLLSDADMVTPDGMPLVWMLKQMGIPQNRVAGMDILLRVCELAPSYDVGIFFLGSEQSILQRIEHRLKQDFPNLKVSGLEPLPFRPLTPEEDEQVIQRINQSGAGIVFVSLGCPKQEQFIAQHRGRINAVMIAVGAVFPVYAGAKKWAPLWVRQAGLEWFYRLVQEPKRLWRRYSRTIPPFLWLAMQQVVTQYPTWKKNPDNFVVTHLPVYQPVGEILQRAGLLSDEQVRHILNIQARQRHLRFGEIQAQQGWLRPETVDFFADDFPRFALERHKQPLGYYLRSAALLDEGQVQAILEKQRENGLRFGEIAVSQGWVKQETISLFLDYMNPGLVQKAS